MNDNTRKIYSLFIVTKFMQCYANQQQRKEGEINVFLAYGKMLISYFYDLRL